MQCGKTQISSYTTAAKKYYGKNYSLNTIKEQRHVLFSEVLQLSIFVSEVDW